MIWYIWSRPTHVCRLDVYVNGGRLRSKLPVTSLRKSINIIDVVEITIMAIRSIWRKSKAEYKDTNGADDSDEKSSKRKISSRLRGQTRLSFACLHYLFNFISTVWLLCPATVFSFKKLSNKNWQKQATHLTSARNEWRATRRHW